jgi:phosphate transport system permease protein
MAMTRRQRRLFEERVFKLLMRASLLIVGGVLLVILVTVTVKGVGALSWEMISQPPRGGFYIGKGGGILNAILGSLALACGATILSLLVALPVVMYMHAYAHRSKIASLVRLSLDVLWGIPSIVYGAFGFTLMLAMGLRASLLGGMIALALVELPILARTMDEVLRMVPEDLREATRSLGTTRLELSMVLLRQTIPGLITAVLLAFGRGIGDAAAVLFTAGYTDSLPQSLTRPVASLPLSVFFQLASPFPEVQQRAYASALVLMVLVLIISLVSRLAMKHLSTFTIR